MVPSHVKVVTNGNQKTQIVVGNVVVVLEAAKMRFFPLRSRDSLGLLRVYS